ncbi:MAG: outer membrane protein transport protein [Nitrospirae bacterium]|nr:outer membrane protein transport protein [Nitrospirota bacterium]
MKKIIYILFHLLAVFCIVSSAASGPVSRIEMASSPNPVGSGARALGMGGAFIAVADDATAASWNPAGLIQLERPEISAVGAYFNRVESNYFMDPTDANGSQKTEKTSLNYLSAVYPFCIGDHNMVGSISYQHLYDFDRKWDFNFYSPGHVTYKQTGKLSAVGLSYSIQLLEQLSAGMTFNVWNDAISPNNWQADMVQSSSNPNNPDIIVGHSLTKYMLSGYNFNLGLLWTVNENFAVGAVFKSPFAANLKREYSMTSTANLLPSNGTVTDNEKLFMPMSYGVGTSYRFSDPFTVSLDFYRTQWNRFILKSGDGTYTSAVTGLSNDASNVKPTNQVRFGTEYLFIKDTHTTALRAGLFYDPSPGRGNPDAFYGFSFGSGISVKRFSFDVAYQQRFGHNVGNSLFPEDNYSSIKGFNQDVNERKIYSSIIYYFD